MNIGRSRGVPQPSQEVVSTESETEEGGSDGDERSTNRETKKDRVEATEENGRQQRKSSGILSAAQASGGSGRGPWRHL